MATAIQKYLLAPRVPNIAAGFVDNQFAVVDVRRGRRGYSLAASAITQLPQGVVTASFDEQNIDNPDELAEIILQTAEAAGLGNKKRWSIALPEGVLRTFVVTLESKPSGRRELNEVLEWKIERVIPAPPSALRISRQRLTPLKGQERYLVSAGREDVISQYESIFDAVRWHAGLILPRHLGEAQWIMLDQTPGDKMLVSANHLGFTALIVRNGEPALTRTYECEPDSIIDELHRFALYYRDRLGDGGVVDLSGLLVLGGINLAEALSAIVDATESEPQPIDPARFGFDLIGEPIEFDDLAGVAGLASIAYQ